MAAWRSLGIALLATGLVACSGDNDAPSTASVAPTSVVKRETTTTYEFMVSRLPDGKYEVDIRGADPVKRTIDVDLVQILRGDAAVRAYHAEHPDDPTGPPNDYYRLNNEPGVWRVPVAQDAVLDVLGRGGDAHDTEDSRDSIFLTHRGTLEELADGDTWFCEITIKAGEVVALKEGYHP